MGNTEMSKYEIMLTKVKCLFGFTQEEKGIIEQMEDIAAFVFSGDFSADEIIAIAESLISTKTPCATPGCVVRLSHNSEQEAVLCAGSC